MQVIARHLQTRHSVTEKQKGTQRLACAHAVFGIPCCSQEASALTRCRNCYEDNELASYITP